MVHHTHYIIEMVYMLDGLIHHGVRGDDDAATALLLLIISIQVLI